MDINGQAVDPGPTPEPETELEWAKRIDTAARQVRAACKDNLRNHAEVMHVLGVTMGVYLANAGVKRKAARKVSEGVVRAYDKAMRQLQRGKDPSGIVSA